MKGQLRHSGMLQRVVGRASAPGCSVLTAWLGSGSNSSSAAAAADESSKRSEAGGVRWSATSAILPSEPVGRGGGGQSHAIASDILRQLSPFDPQPYQSAVSVTSKHGMAVLHDPVLNKGTGFPERERERLGRVCVWGCLAALAGACLVCLCD
jgi:hypothetical protein